MRQNTGIFYNLTDKCTSRHSGGQFVNISTSKSAPKLTCFVHFHFKMCFAPQWRVIFEHLNFKKCSEPLSFLAFSLQNVLHATAACNFSTFHFKMCFSLQRRAIFQHLNFKKWSENVAFCTFSPENVLLTTAACHFSTSQLQKVV